MMTMIMRIKYVLFITITISFSTTYVVTKKVNNGQSAAAAPLSCIDDNGRPVDYYVIYKFPKIEDSESKLLRTGVAYAYIDANSANNSWKLSVKSIEDSNSAIGSSVTPLFNKNTSYEQIVYNDQSPTKGNTIHVSD